MLLHIQNKQKDFDCVTYAYRQSTNVINNYLCAEGGYKPTGFEGERCRRPD